MRQVLVEAALQTVRAAAPMRVFYQRVRARSGHQIAIVATARKLANLGSIRNQRVREAERDLARQAEAAYQRTISDWTASPARKGCRARA